MNPENHEEDYEEMMELLTSLAEEDPEAWGLRFFVGRSDPAQ